MRQLIIEDADRRFMEAFDAPDNPWRPSIDPMTTMFSEMYRPQSRDEWLIETGRARKRGNWMEMIPRYTITHDGMVTSSPMDAGANEKQPVDAGAAVCRDCSPFADMYEDLRCQRCKRLDAAWRRRQLTPSATTKESP